MALGRAGRLSRIARELRLAGALLLFFLSQVTRGPRRRRLLARAHDLDPALALPLLDLLRKGSVADVVAQALRSAGAVDPLRSPAWPDVLQDAFRASAVASVDPARHPRAALAVRFAAYLLASDRRASPSQLGQDLFVTFALGERRGAGTFVEFGATDGMALSNTLRLERDLGWSGILAEPNPAYHAALARNRRCAVSHRCVWSRSGERLAFSVLDAAPEVSTVAGVGGGDGIDRRGARTIEVETVSLDDLLAAHGAPRAIEYVSIDTEGSEAAILGAFDFGAHDVAVFTVEHNHGPGRDAVRDLLTARGYVRVLEAFSRWDDWYLRRDVAQRLLGAGPPA